MEENVLKDFETFAEFPDKSLKINSNSNYFLIKINNKSFVTKRNIDSVSIIKILSNQKLFNIRSFYDVKTGDLVLTTKSVCNIDKSCEEFLEMEDKVEIMSLSSVLNIKGNDVYYLTLEDIEVLLNVKEENAKTFNLKPRKDYF